MKGRCLLVLAHRKGLAGKDFLQREALGRRWNSIVPLLSNCLSRAGPGVAR